MCAARSQCHHPKQRQQKQRQRSCMHVRIVDRIERSEIPTRRDVFLIVSAHKLIASFSQFLFFCLFSYVCVCELFLCFFLFTRRVSLLLAKNCHNQRIRDVFCVLDLKIIQKKISLDIM